MDIAAPLHALTRKSASFVWNPECNEAFDTLKDSLVCAPVLGYPRFGADAGHFQLLTDASAVGLGAVLEQEGHVIAYVSRTLPEPERRYSVIHRECLAVVYALKAVLPLSIGTHFPAHHRSCPTSVAISTENGRYVVSLGSGHAGV